MKTSFFANNTNYSKNMLERADTHLQSLITLALEEDGKDFSAEAIFNHEDRQKVCIITKEDSFAVGLPLIPIILDTLMQMPQVYSYANKDNNYNYVQEVEEASYNTKGTILCTLEAPTILILKAERVILNFISHMSGIANLTNKYVKALEGSGVVLLDTRKTLPAHRFLEKYAVLAGGAQNHRLALDDMIMLKDNHLDALGSIQKAVERVREHHNPCPKIEVECRNIEEVQEAIQAKVDRIMLDNMSLNTLKDALLLIPKNIEAEISGNVNLENIRLYANVCIERRADFISVGKITHSAQVADFSLKTYDRI